MRSKARKYSLVEYGIEMRGVSLGFLEEFRADVAARHDWLQLQAQREYSCQHTFLKFNQSFDWFCLEIIQARPLGFPYFNIGFDVRFHCCV